MKKLREMHLNLFVLLTNSEFAKHKTVIRVKNVLSELKIKKKMENYLRMDL